MFFKYLWIAISVILLPSCLVEVLLENGKIKKVSFNDYKPIWLADTLFDYYSCNYKGGNKSLIITADSLRECENNKFKLLKFINPTCPGCDYADIKKLIDFYKENKNKVELFLININYRSYKEIKNIENELGAIIYFIDHQYRNGDIKNLNFFLSHLFWLPYKEARKLKSVILFKENKIFYSCYMNEPGVIDSLYYYVNKK